MVSIVIPTIGRNESIRRALESAVLLSNILVKEIIVINNSQCDEFDKTLNLLCSKLDDIRIQIINLEKRKTMAGSWNTGLVNASQDWILFLHDDDEILPVAFNSIKNLDNRYSFYSFDYKCSEDGKLFKVIRDSKDDVITSIIRNCPKFVSTLINREKLNLIGGWSDSYGHFLDLMAFLEMANKNRPVFVHKVLGIYYKHNDNYSSLSNRAEGYGNFIPQVTSRFFDLFKDLEHRRELIYLYSRYVYPERRSFFVNIVRKIKTFLVRYSGISI